MMNSKRIKYTVIILSLILFGISLTENAITHNYGGKIQIASSIEYFFMGAMAFMGGGLFEQVIWMANPLSFFAIIFFIKDNSKKAVVLSFIASCLSVSFSFWKEILGAESGSMAEIISLEAGYFLWVFSILVLTIGIFIYYKESLKEIWES